MKLTANNVLGLVTITGGKANLLPLYAFTLTCANAGINKNPSLFWFETIHHLVFVASTFSKTTAATTSLER